ncbi:Mu-like prophage major head subunit gpT family protein [Tabrizicola fusiformis]|uniref:Mu-like prophage major head subunit gpT family protein n=1 Tax=Tabrizicola sp. SY72 TaxID=2741673 RepID=UPI0015737EA1|nr:Mu-like prophage major head subunit gpT family protein [Tabrizicola sp. SY72]NTT86917.1 Mu-like prophage major head subunit gpT family protein [Tabrizicola sp. SY72]
MQVNSATLQALRVGFNTEYQNAFDAVPKMKDRVAKTIRSTTAMNTYGWLKGLTGLREWIGARQIDNLSEASYTLLNKHFEKTVSVNRNFIEDDNLGMYSEGFTLMGDGAARLPEELVWGLLKAGFATNCWDGQYFFDTDHPIMLADGTMSTYANTDGGGGTPWFLMCTNRPLKPIIYQERKAPVFTAKDRETDDNVFERNEFTYGVDTRCNVGYGLPQLAWGSKQTLNATNYAVARTGIMGMKADGGGPLGLIPNLLVVPPSLESAGRKLLNSENASGGETNEWKGTAELLVVPWLT